MQYLHVGGLRLTCRQLNEYVCMYFVHTGTAVKHLDVRFCTLDDPKKREDCGRGGMKKQECLDRLCCWSDIVPGVPWCFHGKYNNHCNIYVLLYYCRRSQDLFAVSSGTREDFPIRFIEWKLIAFATLWPGEGYTSIQPVTASVYSLSVAPIRRPTITHWRHGVCRKVARLIGRKALSFKFRFFYQSTALCSHAVDGHQMYSGGSVVGYKASTIGIEISSTPSLIFRGVKK